MIADSVLKKKNTNEEKIMGDTELIAYKIVTTKQKKEIRTKGRKKKIKKMKT
jgi:hypothetical protein